MALSQHDYRDLLRHFLTWVREMDPVGHERLMALAELEAPDSRQALLNALAAYGESMGARGERSHSAVLYRLNQFVSTEEGRPIQGIRVALSPAEQERYELEYLDLTPGSMYEAFCQALHDLYRMVLREGGRSHDQR